MIKKIYVLLALLMTISASVSANSFLPPTQSEVELLKKIENIESRMSNNENMIHDFITQLPSVDMSDITGETSNFSQPLTGVISVEDGLNVEPGGSFIGMVNNTCLFEFPDKSIRRFNADECRIMRNLRDAIIANKANMTFHTSECPDYLNVFPDDRVIFINEETAKNEGFSRAPSCGFSEISSDQY